MIENKDLSVIKRPNQKEYITKEQYEERVREIARCKRDIVYFAETYYRIQDPDKGLTVIKLYDIQKEFLDFLTRNDRVICCSGRQQGKCVFRDTKISIRNKKTGEIQEISVEDFFSLIKSKRNRISIDIQNKIFDTNTSDVKLSEKTNRKYIDVLSINSFEVLTDSGWEDIVSINKTVKYEIWNLRTKSHSLKCADNHIVFDQNLNEVFIKDLKPGDMIMTDSGAEEVLSIEQTHNEDNMYDLSLPENSNKRFLTNGILSHNSTIYCIYVLWLTCFFPDKQVMMLAQKESTALELLGRIKTGYEYLPTWLKPGCEEFNKKSIKFANRSTIHGFASSSDGVRGQTVNVLVLDEFAFVPKNVANQLFTSVYPTVSKSKNGKIIIVSTPNGVSNLYYDIWKKATLKESSNEDGWRPFTMWWWQVPGHDEAWKKKQIAAIGETRFAQEFNNEFLASSQFKKLIPDNIIEKFRIKQEQMKKNGFEGKPIPIVSKDGSKTYQYKMYLPFDPTRTYLASGDCAEGVGGDDSVLYVWDITETNNIKLCMKFSNNKVSLIEFAWITIQILKEYANPFLAIESNGIGVGYIEQLRMIFGYDNLVRLNRDNGYGINSHNTIRTKACLWFQEMMTTQGFDFQIPDKELIEEFPTFIKKDTVKNDVFAAMPDSHDDHIMSMIWMCWILNEENIEKYFIVSDYFKSSLGKILPKRISPLDEYSTKTVMDIFNDPIYRDFINYQKMMDEKYREAVDAERDMSRNDMFQTLQRLQNMPNSEIVNIRREYTDLQNINDDTRQPMFSMGGGYDWSGGEW